LLLLHEQLLHLRAQLSPLVVVSRTLGQRGQLLADVEDLLVNVGWFAAPLSGSTHGCIVSVIDDVI
jgi:hypothetical protein